MLKKRIIVFPILVGLAYGILLYLSIEYNIHINSGNPKYTFLWVLAPLAVSILLMSYFISSKKVISHLLLNLVLISIEVFLAVNIMLSIIYLML